MASTTGAVIRAMLSHGPKLKYTVFQRIEDLGTMDSIVGGRLIILLLFVLPVSDFWNSRQQTYCNKPRVGAAKELLQSRTPKNPCTLA